MNENLCIPLNEICGILIWGSQEIKFCLTNPLTNKRLLREYCNYSELQNLELQAKFLGLPKDMSLRKKRKLAKLRVQELTELTVREQKEQ